MVIVEQIEEFRKALKKGMLVDVEMVIEQGGFAESKKIKKILKAEVLAVYPHITRTSRGDFRNADLYTWNQGKVW